MVSHSNLSQSQPLGGEQKTFTKVAATHTTHSIPALPATPPPSPIQRSMACNLVFTHKDRTDPVFAPIPHGDIQMQFNSVMAEFYSKETFRARAVGKLWGGDIRIMVGPPEACDSLLERGYEWAHHFSEKLNLREDNFPIIIHLRLMWRATVQHTFSNRMPPFSHILNLSVEFTGSVTPQHTDYRRKRGIQASFYTSVAVKLPTSPSLVSFPSMVISSTSRNSTSTPPNA
jgi:hypothetical protein